MINVYSPTETNFKNNGLATLIPISCDFDIGINDKWQLTMEHPFDKELRYQHLVEDAILRVTGFSCVNEQEQDTNRFGLNGKVQLFRVFDTKKTLTSITVIAFPVALEAVYDTPIENLVIQNKTGIQAGEILDAQTQKYSVSSDITRTASSKYENTNLIASISGDNDDSYVKKWGGEVVYDNNKIKIRNKIGDQSNASAYPIRYGRNLTGLTHEIDMSSVVTRMFPISSDDLRLNVWEDVTSQGGNRYVDSPDHIGDYPFIRCLFVQVDYSLLDTDSNSISETASATNGWREGIINAVTAQATALWTSIIQDLTNTYSPEYIQDLISGEDGIVGYLQKKYVYSHKGWQSFVKSCVKQGVEWIKSEELPTWEWHEDTSVIPHAWWYGDNSVSPAVSYAKNEYVKIGKNYEYFNNDGFWEDYKAMPQSDCDWYEAQDGSGRKWYGYRKGYYAHNEYVYMTVEGQMKEWWYDEEGWYDESRSGDSDMGWHGDATSGYWFGEEGATADDKSKYIHDRWAFIDGTYYWFDTYGYINADPERSFPDWPWGNQKTSEGSLWFGNNSDHGMNAKWLANQWAKIDGEWYYFDADGYVVDMTAKKSETIAWFANTVYNNTIAYITTCLTNAYTLLYRLMTEWCEKQYEDGIDLPTVNVSVDLIDLSKTTEYKDYSNLEKISLGDKVLVIGRDGSRYEERVVGLTFDCIRGYNTRVEVGQLSKSVSQIINVSYSGASEGQKIIAGDGVTIDGKVISVGDYVGRTIGLQDVLLNGSTTVSGNVASFGIQAGENISISRDGNTLTINSTGADGDVNLYHGIPSPSDSLGDDNDIYIQLAPDSNSLQILHDTEYLSGELNYTFTNNNRVYEYKAEYNHSQWYDGRIFLFFPDILEEGKTYLVHFDAQSVDGSWSGIGDRNQSRFYGLAYQKQNTIQIHDGTQYEHVANGGFEYLSQYGDGIYYQSFFYDHEKHTYEFEFVATQQGYLCFYADDFVPYEHHHIEITNFYVVDADAEGTKINKIYYKLNGEWVENESGKTYEAGDNIQISDYGVISATDTDEIAELEDVSLTNLANGEILKYNATTHKWENAEDSGGSEVEANPGGTATDTLTKLGIDGTVYEIQGSGGGGSNLIVDAQIYSLEEKQIGVWVDGRPLYQKTFIRNITLSSGSWVTTGDSILNGKAIAAEVTAIGQGSDTVPVWCEIGADGHIELLNIRGSGQVTITHYTVRYFKTTDAVDSGGFQAYGFTPIIYSTEEREVGVWTDNKPLYAKTYNFNSFVRITNSGADISQYIDNRNDIEILVRGEGFSDDITQAIHSTALRVGYSTRGVIMAYCAEGATVNCITLYYTKITDVAGSGNYTTLGVPAVHYDGNEKIVGTYFGETLYERTLNFTQDNRIYYIPNTTYVKKLVKHNGECTKDNFDFQIPYYDGSNYLSVGNDSNGVRIYSSSYFVGAVYELTIQYTKTS